LSTVNDQSEGSMVHIAQINAVSAAHAGRPPKPPDVPQEDGPPIAKHKGPPNISKEFFALHLNHSLSPLDTKVLSKFLWQRMQKEAQTTGQQDVV